MKKLVLLIIIGMTAVNAHAEVKETISELTKGIIKFTKEVSSGMTEGLKEGRSSTESADGSIVVTNESETLEYIKIDVLSVKGKNESDLTVVEFSFENKHNRPVRITGLGEQGALITIDKEGFSHSLINGNNIEFTVPNEAAKKHSLIFSGSASQVKQVRVWRETYDIDTKFRDASKNTGL